MLGKSVGYCPAKVLTDQKDAPKCNFKHGIFRGCVFIVVPIRKRLCGKSGSEMPWPELGRRIAADR